jgi:hypothetical protein
LEVETQLVSLSPRRQNDTYPAQQFMAKRARTTVVEMPGSHAIHVSNPKAVADVIEPPASGIK